jgi:tripartite-type tricarboxylate transporter receptor subunit TctC
MKHSPSRVIVSIFCCAMLLTSPTAQADNFPEKSIRLIVPFPPGGSPDVVARLLAMKLTERYGQSVVVDNRSGAGGLIGSEMAAKSTPDGYTLLMGNTPTHAIDVSLYRKISYDPVRDFEPIILLATTSAILLANPAMPVTTLAQFIAYAKQNPGKLLYASAGNGTFGHLTMEMFKSMAGINLTHIPYKGNPAGLVDLVAGRIQAMFPTLPTAQPHIRAGTVRAIAISSTERSQFFPDVPTFAEAGVPGYEATVWYGLFAPAKTPRQIITQLNKEISNLLAQAETRKILSVAGADAAGSTPDAFSHFVKSEIAKWAVVIKNSGARVD